VLRNPRDGTTRRRHRHGRSPHAPGEWGGDRYPPFFWLIWQHFPGTPACVHEVPSWRNPFGFLHGGARASRSGPDPPPIRGLSRVRAGRRRGFTPLPATYGCVGGGGARRPSDLSHPPDGACAPPWGRQRATRACTRASSFWAPVTGQVLTPPRSEACPELGQALWHLSFRNPQGGAGGEGAALRDEHISRDPESRGLSHA